jgi:predicted DNA-binding WGR domain protein
VTCVAERIEHWFNRRYGVNRRDVYLLRTETGWQVRGRRGGADGQEATHYFDHEDQARAMVQRMLNTVPPELSNWAK